VEGEALPVFCSGTGAVPFFFESRRLLPKPEGFLQAGKFVFKAFVIETGFRNCRRDLLPRGRDIRRRLGRRVFLNGLLRDCTDDRRKGVPHPVDGRFTRTVSAGPVLYYDISVRQSGHPLDNAEGPPGGNDLEKPAVRAIDPDPLVRIVVGVYSSLAVGSDVLRPEVHLFVAGGGRQVSPPERPFFQERSLEVIGRELLGTVILRLGPGEDKLFSGKERHPAHRVKLPGEQQLSIGRENKHPWFSLADIRTSHGDDLSAFRHGKEVRLVDSLFSQGFWIRLNFSHEFSFSGKMLYVRIHGVPFIGNIERPVGGKGDDRRPGEGSVLSLPPRSPFIQKDACRVKQPDSFAEPVKNGNGAVCRHERPLGVPEGLLGRPEGKGSCLLKGGRPFFRRGKDRRDGVPVPVHGSGRAGKHHEGMHPFRIGFLGDDDVPLHLPERPLHFHIG